MAEQKPKLNAIYSTKGFEAYNGQVAEAQIQVQLSARTLERSRSADHGFLGHVMALRALAEAFPGSCSLIAIGEVETWEATFLKFLDRVKSRFPREIPPDEVRVCALSEFSRLKKCGVNKSALTWQSSLRAMFRYRDSLSSQADSNKPQTPPPATPRPPLPPEWAPCRLIVFPSQDEQPGYSLTYCELDEDEPRLKQRGASNDGYTWQKIVTALLKKRNPTVLKALEFDCESSMFCVRSSDMKPLATVRDLIRDLLADDSLLDEALSSNRARKR